MKARRIGGRKNHVKRRKNSIITVNSHCFDDMTDEMGVTSAFLFTNLAILLSAKAIMRNSRTDSTVERAEKECLIRFRAEYQLKREKMFFSSPTHD